MSELWVDKNGTPNPGSDDAVEHGCTCAVMDNARGNPAFAKMRGGFWVTSGCPLHAPVQHESRPT